MNLLGNFGRMGAALIVGAAVLATPAFAATPDLTGYFWNDHPVKSLVPVGGGPVPLTAAGKKALAENAPKVQATMKKPSGSDMLACLPFGPTRILQQPYPLEIIQKGDVFIIAYEHNHVWERVWMNEKPNPDSDLAYMGYSVGRWEGATAVIETANYNDQTFLDDSGLPHGEKLAVTRRIRKVGAGLEIVTTINDPEMYTKAWSVRTVLTPRPNESIQEYVCGQNTLDTRYEAAR